MKGHLAVADLTDESLDPLIRDIVHQINRSGWVETWFSCQGHPDDRNDPNQRPMLRLTCAASDRGRLATALLDATLHPSEIGPYSATLELWCDPWQAPSDFAITVYVTALTHAEALGVFRRFAEHL